MKKIFVNDIIEMSNNVTYGMAVINKTVEEDLNIMFEPNMVLNLLELARQHAAEGGINLSIKFCQYIAVIQLSVFPQFNGTLNFIDCHNDVDAALDEYLAYTKNDWPKETIDKFMKLFQEIQSDPNMEKAEMIIKDHVDDPKSYFGS